MRSFFYFFSIALCMGCELERPGVTDDKYVKPIFLHGPEIETCSECHEGDRLVYKADVEHGGGEDCNSCHNPSDKLEGWLPPKPYNHEAPTEACDICHEGDRPKSPHVKTGDCKSCHAYPAWK